MQQYCLYVIWLAKHCYITGTHKAMDKESLDRPEVKIDDTETLNRIHQLEAKHNEEMHKLLEEIITSK